MHDQYMGFLNDIIQDLRGTGRPSLTYPTEKEFLEFLWKHRQGLQMFGLDFVYLENNIRSSGSIMYSYPTIHVIKRKVNQIYLINGDAYDDESLARYWGCSFV
jgi:hypothetical protein